MVKIMVCAPRAPKEGAPGARRRPNVGRDSVNLCFKLKKDAQRSFQTGFSKILATHAGSDPRRHDFDPLPSGPD